MRFSRLVDNLGFLFISFLLCIVFVGLMLVAPWLILERIAQVLSAVAIFVLWLCGFKLDSELLSSFCLTPHFSFSDCWFAWKLFVLKSY